MVWLSEKLKEIDHLYVENASTQGREYKRQLIERINNVALTVKQREDQLNEVDEKVRKFVSSLNEKYYQEKAKIEEQYEKEFRQENFPNISDELWQICYSKSYDDNHSGGLDEVLSGMYGLIEFAQKIKSIKE